MTRIIFEYTLGLVCETRGFGALQISVSMGGRNLANFRGRNLAFLPLPLEIEILSIEEIQLIFFPFLQRKCVATSNGTMNCMEILNKFPLYRGILVT